MGLILRQTTTANSGNTLSIKGIALSYTEGDGNFMYLLTNMSGSSNSITGSTSILGGLNVTGGITGSFSGSLLGTASYASNASVQTIGSSLYSINPSTSGFSTSNGIFLGSSAGYGATNASNTIMMGESAGYTSTDASVSVFIGSLAGYTAPSASRSVFIGREAGYSATNASRSVFLGNLAGEYAPNAANAVFIGGNAGLSSTSASGSVFIGFNAGTSQANASYSTFIGYQAGTWPSTLGSNNIIIGTNITLPAGTKDSINIGGIIFATGSYATTTGNPSSSAMPNTRVGIGISTPSASLHVSGTVMFPNLTATSSLSNVILIDTTTGQLYYTSSTAGGISPFVVVNGSQISNGTTATGFYSGIYTAVTGSFGAQTTDWSPTGLAGSYIQMSLSGSTGNIPGKIDVINKGTSSGSLLLNTNGGSVGIGATTFDSTNPEKLLVSGSTINTIVGKANINSYTQLNISNKNAGSSASSDVVATNDIGTESGNFINMGINSSTFNGAIGTASDAYLYNTGSTLWIGNATPGVSGSIKFFAGNNTTLVAMFISSSGNIGIGTTTPSSSLDIDGDLTVKHIKGRTVAPTIVSGSGAGTGATVSITGSNLAGTITLTTAGTPAANATIATISYNTILTSVGYPLITPANLNSAALGITGSTKPVYADVATASNLSFILKSGTTGLTTGLTYRWFYHIMQ